MADADPPEPEPERTVEVEGNRLTLLTAGPGLLTALLALIDGAERSVRLLYYIYRADKSGEQVHAAIERALDRGVKVSLLVDGFGYHAHDDFFTALVDKGLTFCSFHPTFGRRYLIRNHQKLALADERPVLIGGFNVEDSYFGTVEEGAWRDLGLLVEGPAVGAADPLLRRADWLVDDQGRRRSARSIASFTASAKIMASCSGPSAGRPAAFRRGRPRLRAIFCRAATWR